MNVFKLTLVRQWQPSVWYGLIIAVVGWLFVALFNDFKGQMRQMFKAVPAGMEAVMGEISASSTPEGWLALELFPMYVLIGMAILGCYYGAKIIGAEEDAGLLELILSSRTSRLSVALEKIFAAVVLLLLPMVLLWLSIAIPADTYDFHVNLGHVLAACTSGWLVGLLFAAISFFIQSATGKTGLALGVSLGLFAMFYTMSLVAKLVDDLQDLKYWTPVHYFNIPGTLFDGMDFQRAVVLLAPAVLLLVASVYVFNRRDIGC